jgi:hypothetical protein
MNALNLSDEERDLLDSYEQGEWASTEQLDTELERYRTYAQTTAITLDPDVREYFPDSESVNRALRGLIALIPSR